MNLASLSGLGGLERLKAVSDQHSGIRSIANLASCVALEAVSVDNCKRLSSPAALSELKKLPTVVAQNSGVPLTEQQEQVKE
ncbi:hypothetical protein AGDE_15096 [Angomonas deanei]|uniref:Leucine Rich repeat n=1 Tax=Angomonas deanei TaxID=59799 RepID=A0A7G2CQU1_9TRYP|nr:hypothetical protein AGDE_15096 [Angomonas deanei]CAD2222196.1 hypothetical protein, conserved [Angomonas deanei]|eukprot:EPY19700.1 hypothetical protein AGDE_15096 [Angomonas deanei]